jgi:hypothetical protein
LIKDEDVLESDSRFNRSVENPFEKIVLPIFYTNAEKGVSSIIL